MLPSQLDRGDKRLRMAAGGRARTVSHQPPFYVRNVETLRYALPAYVCLIAVIVVTQFWLGHAILNPGYWNSLLVLSSFLAVLALGQGSVILTGGLDLSVPWTIGLCGIILAGMVSGSAASQGTPAGFSSPLLRWFMTGKVAGIVPVIPFMIAFVVFAVVLLGRTPFGRRVYGIGNGLRAAQLSGIAVEKTLILVYMLSSFCAGLVGVMLTGFSGQASLGMGDDYLLPSIAVVVVGGALITGGRGHYLGMLGGVLLLTALQMLLAGTTLPYATRAILYGLVVLGAVMALRERRVH